MKKHFFAALLAAGLLLTSGVSVANGLQYEEYVPITGGWIATESPAVTQEVQEVFEKAMEGFVGVDYQPVAYLGYQIVAGRNHCLLCKAQVVYPNARPYYALMYIYEDLEGNATITNIARLDIAGQSAKKD